MKKLMVVLGFSSLLFSGCSFLSLARKMNNTTISSQESNYESLAKAAADLNWKTQAAVPNAGPMLSNWNLQVFPAEGQKLVFTKNNMTGNIGFACEGKALKKADACIAAADKLFIPAFGATYRGK